MNPSTRPAERDKLRTGYEPIIGLEVHVELKTKSKMFCGCPADYFGREPNSLTCPVCLGLPGALPVPNKKAVDWTILLGLALDCQINLDSKFDRKNYFYPDLPKGYQITQYDQPLCQGGFLDIKSQISNTKSQTNSNSQIPKRIRIRRVHLEEDTGKLLHSDQIPNYDGPGDSSLVDFNRSGVPLVEVVTEPDFNSSEEAKEFLKKLQLIIRYLDISDADMEKGSMRIEPSISLREVNQKQDRPSTKDGPVLEDGPQSYPNYRVEVKNINSFRFAQKAIEYEIKRQTEILERGEKVSQETRGWNEAKAITIGQRTKEEAHDYRYFPEPDIPPMQFTKSQISNLKSQILELPEAKIKRFVDDLDLKESDSEIIVNEPLLAKYFEAAVLAGAKKAVAADKIAKILVNKKIDWKTTSPIQLIISLTSSVSVEKLTSEAIMEVCRKIINNNPEVVESIKSGKKTAIQFLIGQIMKETQGKAGAQEASQVLTALIGGN